MNTPFAFALSILKSQISRRDKYILMWFQDIFKLIDVEMLHMDLLQKEQRHDYLLFKRDGLQPRSSLGLTLQGYLAE